MNNLDEIKYIMELEEEKANLERELSLINDKIKGINDRIKGIRNICSHVSVDLGYYGIYPSTGDEYCCLLCGMGKNREYYYEPRYMVHAKNYLPQYDVSDDSQCIEKLEHIQILALGILKQKPDMTNEELVSRLNTLIGASTVISQDIDKNNSSKLIKKPTSKK